MCLLCCPPGDGALFSFDIRHFCCVRACACGVCVCVYITYCMTTLLPFFFSFEAEAEVGRRRRDVWVVMCTKLLAVHRRPTCGAGAERETSETESPDHPQ